jgi:hypothetical protein
MIPASEVTAVANKIHDLVILAEVTPNRFECKRLRAEALNRSCRFLATVTSSSDDELLARDYASALTRAETEISGANRLGQATPRTVIDLVSESQQQFEFFLKLEYGLLVDSGMEPTFARWMVDTIRDTVKELRTYRASPEDLVQALKILGRHVCHQSEESLASVERGYWRKTLLGGFGGISLVTVNLAAVGFLSPLAMGASSAIGTAFLGQSARRVLEG